MILSVVERIALMNRLPDKGDFLDMRSQRRLKEALSFGDEERAKLEWNQDGDLITWNSDKQEDKEIEIGERANDIIVDCLKKMNEQKQLAEQHLTLYEKFVEQTIPGSPVGLTPE